MQIFSMRDIELIFSAQCLNIFKRTLSHLDAQWEVSLIDDYITFNPILVGGEEGKNYSPPPPPPNRKT